MNSLESKEGSLNTCSIHRRYLHDLGITYSILWVKCSFARFCVMVHARHEAMQPRVEPSGTEVPHAKIDGLTAAGALRMRDPKEIQVEKLIRCSWLHPLMHI